jgi:hypothetical protein
MYLALYTLLIILLTINTITDYIKIKSNKEVIKADIEVYEAQKELSNKLDEKNKILKESKEEIIKVKEHFKELKENLSINYDYLTEEVIKRINENSNKEIVLSIDDKFIVKDNGNLNISGVIKS